MFYNQPFSHQFGHILNHCFLSDEWSSARIAVAWVRFSGMKHIFNSLKQFLELGKTARFVVGVDIENTTYEGLKELLNLSQFGNVVTSIYHNEAHTTFHPKVFMFGNDKQTKVVVGSNNITESGLYRNTEAGLELVLPNDNPIVTSASDAFETWSSGAIGLSRVLDSGLLEELRKNGYVFGEREVNDRRGAIQATGQVKQDGSPLFNAVPITVPRVPGPGSGASHSIDTGQTRKPVSRRAGSIPPSGTILVMRIRKAHVHDRPTQTQIPIKLARDQFFADTTEVVSDHSGARHSLHEASARNSINTVKLEIPEMREMNDPLLRLEKNGTEIKYQVFDSTSAHGRVIMKLLEDGRHLDPPETFLTLPSNQDSSTWWRFI